MEGYMHEVSKRARVTRLAVVTLAALAAIFAAQVSPAQAKSQPTLKTSVSQVCAWNAPGASTFGALSRLAPSNSFAARGVAEKVGREPVARPGVFKGQKSDRNGKDHQSDVDWKGAKVKVYYHVITDGAAGQVTNAMVADQTRVLNVTFAGRTSGSPMIRTGADTEVRFVTAGVDRTNNAHWYAQETFDDEIGMKQALKKGGATDLNVYTTSGGAYLGWAYYPDIVTDPDFSFLDGIVIDYRSMEGPEAYKNYGLGYTLTHETGHWFGLAHTFNEDDTCNPPGDFVDDTPFELTPTSGCPVGKDTCPAPGYDPVHNYMDYSYDACYNQFTDGQSERAAEQFTFWRVNKGRVKNNHH
jgi:hypothetical protein